MNFFFLVVHSLTLPQSFPCAQSIILLKHAMIFQCVFFPRSILFLDFHLLYEVHTIQYTTLFFIRIEKRQRRENNMVSNINTHISFRITKSKCNFMGTTQPEYLGRKCNDTQIGIEPLHFSFVFLLLSHTNVYRYVYRIYNYTWMMTVY